MSETTKIKYIYETTVKKVIKDVKKETREEGGQTVEVSIPIESFKDIKIAILKPDRKTYKKAEIFYAQKLSEYLTQGLLPHSLVAKRYANDGGPLSENEKKTIGVMKDKYLELQTEYFGMSEPYTEEQKTRRASIIYELNEITISVKNIQEAYSSLFENTAENKAQNDTREFWILNLSYIDEDDKGYKPLYGDSDLDTKLNKMEELENKDDPFIREVMNKLIYFISFWVSIMGSKFSEENFRDAENNYQKNVTTYLQTEPEIK